MPFRNETQFTTANVQAMTAAYDSVVAKLKLTRDDERRGKLVSIIVRLAKAGVVDVDRPSVYYSDKTLLTLWAANSNLFRSEQGGPLLREGKRSCADRHL